MCLLVMLMQIGTTPGQTFAVSAFTPALLASLRISQSELALAYMVATCLAAVPLSLIGPAADRLSMRWVSMAAIIGLAGACVFASMARNIWMLGAAFFLLRFLGQGSLSLLAGNTMSMWFRSRIGRASAIISIGAAVAFAIVPEILAERIDQVGWRRTYRDVGLVLAVTLVPPMWLLYRNRPEELGQLVDGAQPITWEDDDTIPPAGDRRLDTAIVADGLGRRRASDLVPSIEINRSFREAIATKSYWVIGSANAMWAMAGTGIIFYLFVLCEDRGLSTDAVGTTFRVFGLLMLVGQLVGGVLADFLPLNRLLGCGVTLLVCGLTSLWFHFAQATIAFGAAYGLGQGLLIATTGALWVRFYGRESLGSIRGSVWCATVAGSGLGPLLMGSVRDQFGSYDPAILSMVVLLAPLAIGCWFVRPPN